MPGLREPLATVRPARPREPGCPDSLAALQAASPAMGFTQGIGLRPKPWAPVSRPVGPVRGTWSSCEPQRRVVTSPEEEAQHLPRQLGRGRFPLRRLAEEIQGLPGFVVHVLRL